LKLAPVAEIVGNEKSCQTLLCYLLFGSSDYRNRINYSFVFLKKAVSYPVS